VEVLAQHTVKYLSREETLISTESLVCRIRRICAIGGLDTSSCPLSFCGIHEIRKQKHASTLIFRQYEGSTLVKDTSIKKQNKEDSAQIYYCNYHFTMYRNSYSLFIATTTHCTELRLNSQAEPRDCTLSTRRGRRMLPCCFRSPNHDMVAAKSGNEATTLFNGRREERDASSTAFLGNRICCPLLFWRHESLSFERVPLLLGGINCDERQDHKSMRVYLYIDKRLIMERRVVEANVALAFKVHATATTSFRDTRHTLSTTPTHSNKRQRVVQLVLFIEIKRESIVYIFGSSREMFFW
jgi:hypothetical protein